MTAPAWLDEPVTTRPVDVTDPWTTLDLGALGDADPTLDPHYEWVLPGLLERGSRMILAGDEGTGKSLCIGQLVIRLAAGIPALPGPAAGPMRVLVVDTELNERTIRRRLRPMAEHAALPPGQLLYVLAPAGIDLLRTEEAAAFARLCGAHRPHLVVIDSLYRAFIGDPDDPRVGGQVQRTLDEIRASTGAALLLACHYRKRSSGGPQRRTLDDLAGSRVWKAWPETVVDLTNNTLRILKDREGRTTALAITRATAGEWEDDPEGWPFTFTAAEDTDRTTWQGHTLIQRYALQVLARGDAELSTLQIVKLITEQRALEGHRSGFHRTNVTSALGELQQAGRVTSSTGPRNANLWRITAAGLEHISRPAPEETDQW